MSLAAKRITYRFLQFSSSLQYWISRRLTPAGQLILVSLAVSALLGLGTNRPLSHQIFALLLSFSLVAIIFSLFPIGNFTAERALPRYVTAGQRLSYEIVIKNETPRTQKGLWIQENFADPRPSFQEFCAIKEPGEERRNILDRTFGAYRWEWLVARRQRAKVAGRVVPTLPPGGRGTIKMELTPLSRGKIELQGIILGRPDPFGLFKSLNILPIHQTLISLPRRYPVSPVRLEGSRKYHPGGVALSSDVGDSGEFIGLRDYRPGDPLRHIHWKSWARTGNPVVREFGEEYFSRYALLLDTFAGPELTEVFEEAVSVVASFAARIETRETLLDFLFVSDKAYCLTAGRGLSSADPILEVLATLEPRADQGFASFSGAVLDRAFLLNGCLFVLLSWDPERRALIQRLKAQGIRCRVIVITQPGLAHSHDPGAMKDDPESFYVWERGKVAEGIAGMADPVGS